MAEVTCEFQVVAVMFAETMQRKMDWFVELEQE